ncbi:hypothetical protein TIFTF001_023179 [Ficus carica]|uniref:Uncharacterized protein n=1 Tax=Ficus carica TaxID=3494 RepID=A0AA88AFQ2_FICCA|nr:hypothetical protein TIFTF001_023179 [Ficus carica]
MGVTGKGATVPVRAGDRRVVQEQGWLYYPDPDAQSTTPSEHVPVPARTGEVVGQRNYSRRTSDSKHCRLERGRRIGQQTASGEAHPPATCRLCLAPLAPRGTPPRAGRQSGTLNFEISNFELELEVGGKSNRRLENRARILRSTLAYK